MCVSSRWVGVISIQSTHLLSFHSCHVRRHSCTGTIDQHELVHALRTHWRFLGVGFAYGDDGTAKRVIGNMVSRVLGEGGGGGRFAACGGVHVDEGTPIWMANLTYFRRLSPPILGHRSRRRDIRGRVCDIHEGVQGAQRRAAGKRWNRRGMRGIISARPRPRADMTKGWCWWPPDAGWRAGCALANAALANAARIQGPGPWTYARTAPPAHHHHTTTTKRALPQPQPQPQGTTDDSPFFIF
jgi:hypothetical protein